MSIQSAIEWTETTWNPTTGCDRVSAGCEHCYALTLAKRLKAMGSAKYQADGDPRTSGPGFGVAIHEAVLDAPLRWREPRLVFVDSMSDLFHARIPAEFVRRVFTVMAATPQHTYQVLTKRSTRLRRLSPVLPWPPNVWMGVSVENASALGRVEDLRHVPAAVRFLSCEPLLGPLPGLDLDGIGWVIAGGESGRHARRANQGWFTGLRDLCQAAGVPFFFKLLCTKSGLQIYVVQAHLSTCGYYEFVLGLPQIDEKLRWDIALGGCRSSGGDAASQVREVSLGNQGLGSVRDELDSHQRGLELLSVRSAGLIEERHRLACPPRVRGDRNLRTRLKGEGDELPVGRQEIAVGRQANVPPLAGMVTTPRTFLTAKRQPATKRHTEQRDEGRDRASASVHGTQPPEIHGNGLLAEGMSKAGVAA